LSQAAAERTELVFHGGSILTMDAARPRVEAVAVRGGRITAAGSREEALAAAGTSALVIDLDGRALLPGFIDGHGHIAKVASSLASANLAGPPVGRVTDIETLVEELRSFARERSLAAGTWISGRGYDPAFLAEGRHPTRHDLDRVSREHPVYIGHVSGHLGAANSLALEMAGISADTTDPPGGVIRREAGGEPNGVLEENAMGAFTAGLIPLPNAEEQLRQLEGAQRIYAASGLTTAQEGAMFPAEQALFEQAAEATRLFLDVHGYAFWAQAQAMLEGRDVGRYSGRFRPAGMKLMLDGSPQGKTAWLTAPYHVIPEGQPADYRGYAAMPDEQAQALVARAFERGWQVIAHCNGDAAADQYIAAVRRAEGSAGARRPVMIHAQTVREDQLDDMAELGILPSFFASHVYYWGDYHRDSVLGPDRASRISPMRSAQRRGMRFNLHNDSPVVPPDVLRLVWSAVARKTRTGEVLGPEQAIPVADALRAVTIDAAYAHFEEGSKGSITPGKLADLVVLSADPAAVETDEIPSIQIEATLKEGVFVHGSL